ncbi:DUF2987 domain-containing protein [Vibrio sp.]|uniref:DUF2987 domain-containing protein n=1 Tax=Vibrio sp. TaxID=678 RepID=UPI003D0DA500
MNKITTVLLTGLSLLSAVPASAQEYMFTYSKLFSQLKNNVEEGHDDVKVGIFFVNAQSKQLCEIEKAWMEKEQHYEELKVAPSKELLLPLDNNLKQANPLVFVRTPQDLRCDFSTVVMARQQFDGKVTDQQMANLLPQMQALLEGLGGMFASWFTPEVEGLTFEFPAKTEGVIEFSNGKVAELINGKAQITLDEIGKGGYITLPASTIRVLPYLPDARK